MAEEKMSPEEFRRHYPEYTSKASTPQDVQYFGPIAQERVANGPMKGIAPMPINELDNWFTYHAPTPDQVNAYATIRSAAKHLAELIYQYAPYGRDRDTAVLRVREAVMLANAAIACGGW